MTGLREKLILVAALVVTLIMAGGCGGDAEGTPGSPRVLSTEEARELLLELPYKYRFRKAELPEGASGVLAGTAIGKHHTVLHFGISLGTDAEAVSVPRAGILDPYYYRGAGYVFNSDLVVPKSVRTPFHTRAQWNEAIHMVFEMTEKLCRASTGELCPI